MQPIARIITISLLIGIFGTVASTSALGFFGGAPLALPILLPIFLLLALWTLRRPRSSR